MLKLLRDPQYTAFKAYLHAQLSSQESYIQYLKYSDGTLTKQEFKMWLIIFLDQKVTTYLFNEFVSERMTTFTFSGWFNKIRHSKKDKDYLRRFCELMALQESNTPRPHTKKNRFNQ